MSNNTYAAMAILIMAGVTLLLRVLPFIMFGDRKTPAYIDYLGKFLPYAIMGMLVVYCLKSMSFIKSPFGIPELAAVALVVVLHAWKRNTLLSIVSGTIGYMLLIRLLG